MITNKLFAHMGKNYENDPQNLINLIPKNNVLKLDLYISSKTHFEAQEYFKTIVRFCFTIRQYDHQNANFLQANINISLFLS